MLRNSTFAPIARLSLAGLLASFAGHAVAGDGSRGSWWESHLGCQHCAGSAWSINEPAARTRAAFDEATGRNLLNYPPHRLVDYKHMKLAIVIPNMNIPMFEAVATLTIQPISSPISSLTLNVGPSPSMEIHKVTLGLDASSTTTVSFVHEGEQLRLVFEPPIAPANQSDLIISYTLNDPHDGITWTPESPAWPGRPAQLHSQGQPESNHYWFPCHDFPNERLTTELFVMVPEGFQVVSNGKLVESKSTTVKEVNFPNYLNASPRNAGASGQSVPVRTFHWLQDKPHVNYLVTLVVGKFDVVDVGTSKLPMPVYAPVGRGGDVKRTYGRTGRMVSFFARLIDEPYPWDKYAQVVAWNFGAGGMENTSATTMFDTAIFDEKALQDGDLDGLISHELAHQWFGDLLTCNSWEHIWLNEGFATYFTHLWFEERDGRDAYLSALYGTYRNLANNDKADAPYQPAMCSKEYTDPWEVFRRASNPYPKGASVLHMIREKLGDKLFYDALKLHVDRSKFGSPETDDLRYAFEEVSGLSLDRFFRQWCYKPGVPLADVSFSWDSASSSLNVSLTQTQNIDGYNPAFFFTLPIWVKLPGGGTQTLELEVDGKTATNSFQLAGEPALIAVDPNLAVLAGFNGQLDAAKWRELLTDGPTIASKHQAVAAIQNMGSGNAPAEAVMALNAVAKDTRQYHALRSAAVEALGVVGTSDLLIKLANDPPSDARVRKAVVEQIPGVYEKIRTEGNNTPARLIDSLRKFAKSDSSYAVRSAAIRGLAKVDGGESKSIIVDALNVESQHDQIRQAALDALGTLNDAEGLAAAVRYSGPGAYARTRPTAVNAIVTLASHDRELAYNTLVELLQDPHDRTARAAGDGLVKLADRRAETVFESFIQQAPTSPRRNMGERWLKELRESKGG